ncbi:MAG: murein biosynthesis integral membrane protein MurJ [Robiginitomaculum sp.]|nr:MAG: murein biosynthesis integral membrane protein MurJ [Robiginitomaculum sp.]
MRLIKSTAIIGTLTLFSRILGLVRDTLMTRYLGAGPITDALITAFKIPNTFRRIFAEGAFNAAFVPLYARRIEDGKEGEADTFASEAMAALFVLVAGIVIVFEMTMPWTLNLFGIGLDRTPLEVGATFPANLSPYDLAVVCAQITMPYLLLMSLTALFSGILNTRHHFAVAAFTPVLLNIVLIGVLFLMSQAGWSLSLLTLFLCAGMTLSGVFQIVLVFWACKQAGVNLRLKRPRLTPGVRRLFVLGVPGMLAAGVTHINIMVSNTIATLQDSAASWLYWADRLYQLPLGMIGIAMGVALLPSLARSLRAGDEQGAKNSLNRAMEISAILTLPAAFALAVMPEFLISGLFERGAFDHADTIATGQALRMFAFGLPAFVLIKVLTPAFFARENTKTPMIYAAISAVLNLVLGYALFIKVGFWGLAVATSVAAWVNVFCLTYALLKSGDFAPDKRLISRLPRIILASAAMGVGVYWLSTHFTDGLGHGFIQNYFLMALVSGLGLCLYALTAFVLRAYTLSDIRNTFPKRKT